MTSTVRLLGAFALTALAVLAVIVWPGGRGPEASSPASDHPPVVVIVLDEFPTTTLMDGHGGISRKRFPNFWRLAREGTWYPNNTTVSSWTYRAVPAMLSGRDVGSREIFPVSGEYPQNLFTRLDGRGYRVKALEAATQLCPRTVCKVSRSKWLDPAGFSAPIRFVQAKTKLTWERVRWGQLRWAKSLVIRPRSLNFAHFQVPHNPYLFLPSGKRYETGPVPRLSTKLGPRSKAPLGNVRLTYQRLMLQVGYVDRVIGAVRRQALRQGRWKSMMLVVAGDHGQAYRRGRLFREVEHRNLGSVAFTPLFIKYPGTVRGGVSPLATQVTDVFPTIAARTGAKAAGLSGTTIADLDRKPRVVHVDGQSFSFAEARRRRDGDVEDLARMLGRRGLYALGPASGLIGTRVAGRPLGGAALDRPELYRSVRRKAPVLPALITGTTDAVGPRGIVAVAVNGTIRGTAQVFPDAGRRRFGTVINPRFLRRDNRIGIYAVKRGRIVRRLR